MTRSHPVEGTGSAYCHECWLTFTEEKRGVLFSEAKRRDIELTTEFLEEMMNIQAAKEEAKRQRQMIFEKASEEKKTDKVTQETKD